MKKVRKFLVFLFMALASLLLPQTALAVCPVCTLAVGAGLGLSRFLGVDDTISGVWIGGLILSSSFWLLDWLKKKSPKFLIINYKLLIIFAMYALILGPLAWTEIIGHPFNRLWGIDKLIVGTAFGSLAFWLSLWLDKKVRKMRGKQLFNYQKIVFPVGLLLLSSILVWIIIKNY
jgi:hypothetical protein